VRLRSIAREAAEQSERGLNPSVDPPVALGEALLRGSVLLFERGRGARLSALVPAAEIVIGPEGGFTRREVDAAEAAGAVIAGLGPRILRSETVAVAAATVILSSTGDFA
jgi:16S rRNA (uracil1498-N3)-methyltransferase